MRTPTRCDAYYDENGVRCEDVAIVKFKAGCVHEHIDYVDTCYLHEGNMDKRLMHCGTCFQDGHLCTVVGKRCCNCTQGTSECFSIATQDVLCDLCASGCNGVISLCEPGDFEERANWFTIHARIEMA